MAEHGVMEGANVELRPVAGAQLRPEPLDLALADLVGERLARPADVAVGFDHRVGLGQPGVVAQEVDRALTLPAQCVHAGVDDQAPGAPRLGVEHAEALALRAV